MIAKLADNRVYRTYLGGRRIDAFTHHTDAPNGHFPEDWLASTVRAANPGRESIVEGLGHTAAGTPVSSLVPEGLPILVKLLDAAERLVIQAHPTIAFARERFHSDFGKTECWYILEAEPDACVYLGFREGISRREWEDCFHKQDTARMLSLLHRFPVRAGDFAFVPGGVAHAIGGGCLMIETQEPTDLMVVPERVTPSGAVLPERKLHGGLGFDGMFDCFEYDGLTEDEARGRFFPRPTQASDGTLLMTDGAVNGRFTVARVQSRWTPPTARAVAVVTAGEGRMSYGGDSLSVSRGDRLLLLGSSGDEARLEGVEAALCAPAL